MRTDTVRPADEAKVPAAYYQGPSGTAVAGLIIGLIALAVALILSDIIGWKYTYAAMGVFLVVGPGSGTPGFGWGELAGIASAVLGAGAVTSIRALRATDNAPTIFFAFCLGGLVVSIPLSIGGGIGQFAIIQTTVGAQQQCPHVMKFSNHELARQQKTPDCILVGTELCQPQ